MKIKYTPQSSYDTLEYDNDIENEIVRATVNGETVIEHDLSNVPEYDPDKGRDFYDKYTVGFPVVGFPRRIDGELHVTLIEWYN